MYEGLYDTRKGLSGNDAKLVGAMTAQLLDWTRWVHRRVEHVTFCDEDAVRRNVSIDFTLPPWFHDIRSTPPGTTRRNLVPLGFLRKAVLVNFSLRDESDTSLPLLTAKQNTQVAEATLRAMARTILGDNLPNPITCDIRRLVREAPDSAERAYFDLLNHQDSAHASRQLLKANSEFANTALLFRDNFLALSMLDIRRHERRVLHMSYEKLLWDRSRLRVQLSRVWRLAKGNSRILYIAVPSVSEAESHHLELEAPDGLMITRRESFFRLESNEELKRDYAPGGYRRAHFHFADVAAKSKASAVVHLRPRRSSGIRAATLMAVLASVSIAVVAWRYPYIEQTDRAATAGLLLAAAGIVGFIVTRSGENELATAFLYPLRTLATVPVISAVFATIVVVADLSVGITRPVLGAVLFLIISSIWLLALNWIRIRRALRRYEENTAPTDDDSAIL